MEYKKHTAMPPQDAKEAMEKYKLRRKDKEYWLYVYFDIYLFHLL